MKRNYKKDNKVREVLSTKVLTNLGDYAKEAIIRHIIFSMSEGIKWEEVKTLILEHMPELMDEFDV